MTFDISLQDSRAWNLYKQAFGLSPHCGYTWFDLAPQIQILYRIKTNTQMLLQLAPHRHP